MKPREIGTRPFHPVTCGCGGHPKIVEKSTGWYVQCQNCRISTSNHLTQANAVKAWNVALNAEAAE